jgi:hypothetical protein
MKYIIIFIILINFQLVSGQEFEFGVIHDKDGFVNVRSSKNLNENNIVDKLENGFVITHFGAEENWIYIDYKKNNKNYNGYIYFDRIKSVLKFETISKKENYKNQIIFSNKKIEVKISYKIFDKSKHSYEYYKNNPNQLYKIDNKEIFGTDGNLPRREYKSIEIIIDDKIINLPKEAIENLYEPNSEFTLVNFDEKTDTLYIQALNGDGAGGYAVLWIIENNNFKKRITSIPF